jgi:hypothetical protein
MLESTFKKHFIKKHILRFKFSRLVSTKRLADEMH